jgi:purine-binding chemotaxis protein CheW
MSSTITETAAGRTMASPGKYLTFKLGEEAYGLPVLKVREIIRHLQITAVPQMPPYVKGVTNLRGKIIPVVDLRLRFGLGPTDLTDRSCIVVVQVEGEAGAKALMGLLVDAVEEVTQISAAEIQATPEFGAQLATNCLLGIAQVRDGVKTLLNIDQAVTF